MVLTKFTDTAINYTVTGFLINEDVQVSVMHAANAETAINSTLSDTTTFNSDITAIGNSWYKLSGMSIVPLDTMVYFIKTPSMEIYKMQVTFFESGLSGKGRVGVVSRKLFPETSESRNDTLVMGSNYANDVYFRLAEGTVRESSRASWDIAFKTNTFTASIWANSTMGISLYKYPKAGIEAWIFTSVNPKQTGKIEIYPNPASDILYFSNDEWKAGSTAHLELFNIAGRLVSDEVKIFDEKVLSSDVSELGNGLYHFRITHDGRSFSGRFVISR
jgi:hypothetical protein